MHLTCHMRSFVARAILPLLVTPPLRPSHHDIRPAAVHMSAVFPPEERTVPNVLQTEAIRSTSDAVLLLASPGTGKTRVMRARLAYLISKGVPASAILVVTFTQHAAKQLKLRVGVLAGDAVDGVLLGTFHSICARMLRENAELLSLTSSFVILGEVEQLALLSSLMKQVGMHGARRLAGNARSLPTASNILHCIQRWKEAGLRPGDVNVTAADDTAGVLALRLYPEYQRRLRQRGPQAMSNPPALGRM